MVFLGRAARKSPLDKIRYAMYIAIRFQEWLFRLDLIEELAQLLTNFFSLNESEGFENKRIRSGLQLKEELQHSTGLSNVIYEPTLLSFEEIQPLDRHFSGKTFENMSFSRTTISGIIFSDCKFIDCLFQSTKFVNCEFHNCTFSGCNPNKD